VDEKFEVTNVFMIEDAKAAAKARGFRDYVARCSPELEDAVPSAFGDPTALDDVGKVEQLAFVQSDGGDLDIAADSASRHTGE
jgi:hypothetical protein